MTRACRTLTANGVGRTVAGVALVVALTGCGDRPPPTDPALTAAIAACDRLPDFPARSTCWAQAFRDSHARPDTKGETP